MFLQKIYQSFKCVCGTGSLGVNTSLLQFDISDRVGTLKILLPISPVRNLVEFFVPVWESKVRMDFSAIFSFLSSIFFEFIAEMKPHEKLNVKGCFSLYETLGGRAEYLLFPWGNMQGCVSLFLLWAAARNLSKSFIHFYSLGLLKRVFSLNLTVLPLIYTETTWSHDLNLFLERRCRWDYFAFNCKPFFSIQLPTLQINTDKVYKGSSFSSLVQMTNKIASSA